MPEPVRPMPAFAVTSLRVPQGTSRVSTLCSLSFSIDYASMILPFSSRPLTLDIFQRHSKPTAWCSITATI
ncbi:hypothetical protein FRC03_006895 [Tulasnella sp. 419]|nr:hypothetical protein FRC03_006895 [Tulasnella sp. 419]